jgi:prephenate dehydratase
MAFQMHKVQVWSGEIEDRAGAAAAKLELLAQSGADLEFIFTRPTPGKPGNVTLFLAPINGAEQSQAAQKAGLAPARDFAMLCVEGDNRPGLGYEMMRHVAIAGINLRGISISALGHRFAAYLAFDNADAVAQAVQLLAGLST